MILGKKKYYYANAFSAYFKWLFINNRYVCV